MAPFTMMPVDTFFFMLDRPDLRNLDTFSQNIEYMSEEFDQSVYERSRGQKFKTREDAYFDWVHFGKRDGLLFAEGKHTLLKVILKVKNETHIIAAWIEYYAELIGCHNIIIADCGSTDSAFFDVVKRYEQRILIIKYREYYDHLNWVHANKNLFKTILLNCKYVAVLDADEFIFGHSGGTISKNNVVQILQEGSEEMYAGTWLENETIPENGAGDFDLSLPMEFSLDDTSIKYGTIAGKLIVKSSSVLAANYIGHNLGVKEVVVRLRPSSFGKIGIFHVNRYGAKITKSRSLMHLRAKGVVSDNEIDDEIITKILRARLADIDTLPIVALYIRRYLGDIGGFRKSTKTFKTYILAGADSEKSEELSQAFEAFDFPQLLHEKVKELLD